MGSMYSLCYSSIKYMDLRRVFLPRTFYYCLCEIEQVALLFRTGLEAAGFVTTIALEKMFYYILAYK